MDSFFERPRDIPEPISIDKFTCKPSVPEVSMISTKHHQPSGTYRNFQKQVRFQSPPLQQNQYNFDCNPLDKAKDRNGLDFGEASMARKEKLNSLKATSSKPFEQIYMANIPDRKLDLSLLEIEHEINNKPMKDTDGMSKHSDTIEDNNVPNKTHTTGENKENSTPKSYQEFLLMQKQIVSKRKEEHNDSVTDIFNYKRNQQNQICIPSRQEPYKDLQTRYNFEPISKRMQDSETQTNTDEIEHSKALQNKKDYEPSNADLLKIIAQQNEQLLLLQKQVALLLDREKHFPKSIETGAAVEERNFNLLSTPQKNLFRQENTVTQQASIFKDNQRTWGMSKFSINVTTSLEMPIRAQQKQNFVNHEPKIQEITESDLSPVKTDNLDQSIRLGEQLRVREPCPSPQPSINIDMNDFDSSSDEESSSDIGVTFYNNLMGQVNNMLKNANAETDRKTVDEDKNKMLNKVKEATLKHLKNVGISMGPVEEGDESEGGSVQQLFMKYLPNERLQKREMGFEKEAPAGGFITPRPEFSLASLEYMKKYNLIPSKEKVPDFIVPRSRGLDDRKILDLTALKMQPKLM
ncbi:unnamed protein product [Phyllotreta striolata]|uniref:Uncharacterized protein n=1 Tax=Phyllotreta striolata TaxID=444603 RepID=A0A9N9TZ80_PHYSR|nr:unnamed protein product [Phyllotreta striolata]